MKLPATVYLNSLVFFALSGFMLTAQADSRSDNLARCLKDFDGMQWLLPYQPSTKIRSCNSPNARHETGIVLPEGQRELELMADLGFIFDVYHTRQEDLDKQKGHKITSHDADTVERSDRQYAAIQNAMFAHFDGLIKRHGYRREDITYGDARTRVSIATQRMLNRLPPLSKEVEDRLQKIEDSKPPIPYSSEARYIRSVSGRYLHLNYAGANRNTWKIQLSGLPDTTTGSQK
ncbi:hypothetical protein ACO0LD_02325 [Undibacterium sp. Ji83W]|uniref:hypothetical protein n=1 Tax=Undibacterium sp. Ji83W TaxID=3413043 RepID=UPI003BF21C77